MTNANVESIVSAYIKVRDEVAQIKASHKAQLEPYTQALDKLESQMLQILSDAGVESMKTAAGTAYRSEKASVTVADKSAFMDFIESNKAFDLLDVRANKTAVEGFMAEHQDVPPGVNIRREVTVNFRRA